MDIELDRQYSCSKWTVKGIAPKEAGSEFVRITGEASHESRKTVPNQLNIRYGVGERQLYDSYGIDLPSDSEVVVFVHGGYWQDLTKETSANMVKPLYEKGLRVIVADYDLCPTVSLKRIIQEVHELFFHVLSTYNKARGIWLSGHSAGAHLCSTALDPNFFSSLPRELSSRLRGLILISGIYDVVPIVQTSINEKLSLSRQDAEAVSTVKFFEQSLPELQFFITHGEAEGSEFYRQSLEAHEKALRSGMKSHLEVIFGHDHFTIVEGLDDPSFELTKKILAFVGH